LLLDQSSSPSSLMMRNTVRVPKRSIAGPSGKEV
jgi:hypothetical protein